MAKNDKIKDQASENKVVTKYDRKVQRRAEEEKKAKKEKKPFNFKEFIKKIFAALMEEVPEDEENAKEDGVNGDVNHAQYCNYHFEVGDTHLVLKEGAPSAPTESETEGEQ